MSNENKNKERISTVKNIMKTIFNSQSLLQKTAPEFKWAGLGNLLGDYGEFVGIDYYGFKQAPRGSDGYDAITTDGKTVQIKTNYYADMIGFRGDADLMLVIKVKSDGSWEELYYGDFNLVVENSNYSKRDNKKTITINKLKNLK